MVLNRSFSNILTHKLAATALLCIYGLGIIGASALLLGASSTSALARGGHGGFHGGGFHGGGFHGHGFYGRGFGPGFYPYPYGYYAPPPPAYYPPPAYAPRSCWDPYYRRYYAC